MSVDATRPASGSVPNSPELISRAVTAYLKAAGPGAAQPDKNRTYHAVAPDGRHYVIVRDAAGEILTRYVQRGNGKLKIALRLPDDLPEPTDSRITETAPGQYTATVRLRDGAWVTSLTQFTSEAEARQWAAETARADGFSIADQLDVRKAREDAPSHVRVEVVPVPRWVAVLDWTDGRSWQCDHGGHADQDSAQECARLAAVDPATEPDPPRKPYRGPNGHMRHPGRPIRPWVAVP